ncbi:DUF5107 domain-containing protein [Photobacterium sagamiensis]|uniref:DUF5107 domain-containing protein n=1 Tax=Photobacterium sagamiensis TaxID=2910241 RepID=UPI003D141E4F
MKQPVIASHEKIVLPTYVPPEASELPFYSEFRQHQGSTGYAYPNRITQGVERETVTDVEYDVVRLENEYIRILILPALGGRILEGYDKKNDYHFLYRHTMIKPVLVGSYGSWISGGMEWNFPFHHRPSTFMSVDYEMEEKEDGTMICWLSEASCSPGQYRIKGMVGIALRPDASYFETKVKLANRTETEHPFMWWENAGVHVNDDYQLFFPQDVNWIHHHNDNHHATFPIHKGWYAVERTDEETDISIHKNTKKGNSFFSGPSKYDFFGGYDHRRDCGVMHVANHHISPGKKMFQWALEDLGDAWNSNLTDCDGEHAELMAGSFADDQPDFTWLAPFETKSFSQFWYPFQEIGSPVYADLNGAVAIDREKGEVGFISTTIHAGAKLVVKFGDKVVIEETFDIAPSEAVRFNSEMTDELFTVELYNGKGEQLFSYTEDRPELVRVPEDNPGRVCPNDLTTAQEITLAGRHVEQYRDPVWKKEEYYTVALERDPKYIPALIGMAGVKYENAMYEEALDFLRRAEEMQNVYNQNPSDGTVSHMKGLNLFALERFDEAYDAFYKASWSHNVISYSMTFIAAIDCMRGDYDKMYAHANQAISREAEHPIAGTYAAIAAAKLGNKEEAVARIEAILENDKLDHLARYEKVRMTDGSIEEFFSGLNSNPSQTALDIAFDLFNAGLMDCAIFPLEALKEFGQPSAMALYTLAYLQEIDGDLEGAKENRKLASVIKPVDTFPYRPIEIKILEAAVTANPQDAMAGNLLGCILYDKRHFEKAEAVWEATIAAKPDFYMPYRNLSIVKYSKLEKREEALPLLKKALDLKPGDDFLLKEVNYVMGRMGTDGHERVEYVEANMPEKPSDHLTWELADAYSNIFEFDKALDALYNHEFVAAECCETYLTEAYTFACMAKGRIALEHNKLEKALELFEKGQQLPANFRAGWWDTQALYHIRYFQAETLMKLGRGVEARAIVDELVTFIRSAYSPYMGPEVEYYIASAYRLIGEEITAIKLMSKSTVEWEKELLSDIDRKLPATAVYISHVDDAAKVYKGAILTALGYSKLFFGEPEAARELFAKSIEIAPDHIKAKFEIAMLDKKFS